MPSNISSRWSKLSTLEKQITKVLINYNDTSISWNDLRLSQELHRYTSKEIIKGLTDLEFRGFGKLSSGDTVDPIFTANLEMLNKIRDRIIYNTPSND